MVLPVENVVKQIRKLRKKLRQIERLGNLDRELTDEEKVKVSKKQIIRDVLSRMISQYPEFQQPGVLFFPDESINTHDSLTDNGTRPDLDESILSTSGDSDVIDKPLQPVTAELDTMSKRKAEDTAPQSAKETKVSPHIHVSNASTSSSSKSPKESPSSEAKRPKTDTHADNLEKDRASWKNKSVEVSYLPGHNDLITAIDTDGKLAVTSSRDTTVKVWDLESLNMLKNLGGHTDSVTMVSLLSQTQSQKIVEQGLRIFPHCYQRNKVDKGESLNVTRNDRYIISTSLDCTIRIWSFASGQSVKRIYTFDPMTGIVFITDHGMLCTGSAAGKLSLWSVETGEIIYSVNAHKDRITGLQFRDGYIYSSSSDGVIKVHQLEARELSSVFVSTDVKSMSKPSLAAQHIHTLLVNHERIFIGDDGDNIKLVDWKSGTLQKVPNNLTEFGSTDAICSHANLLISAAYDLDNGLGYLNVWDSSGPNYLATLSDDDTGRVLSLACHHSSHCDVILSGGMELKVWKCVNSKLMGFFKPPGSPDTDDNHDEHLRTIISSRFYQSLGQKANDSDSESDYSDDDDDDDEGGGGDERLKRIIQKRKLGLENLSNDKEQGWFSWCSIL